MILSQANAKAAEPGAILRDDTVKGLQLRVFPERRSFYVWYRFQGQERRPKIGDFPSLSITAAREIARALLARVAAGEDPSAQRQQARAAARMDELADRYIERHAKARKAKSSAYQDGRFIVRFVKPKLGALKVADVDVTHVEDLLDSLAATPVQANRVRSLLAKMFTLAEKWKMRPLGSNPVKVIERQTERKRRRYMTRDEATAVVERLRFYEDAMPRQAAFLWLSIYTGARPGEIARWTPEHYRDGKIVLDEHKTAHTGDARVIHLPPQAVALLDRLPRVIGQPLVGVKSCRSLWDKIVKDTGIKNLRRYDMRHTFASIGLSNGLTLGQVGELLGHKSTQTTSRYAHLIDEQAAQDAAKIATAFDAFARPKLKVVK